jgi:hypothetical protein
MILIKIKSLKILLVSVEGYSLKISGDGNTIYYNSLGKNKNKRVLVYGYKNKIKMNKS